MKEIRCEMCRSTNLIADSHNDVQTILNNAFLHIADGKWKTADELLDKALSQNSENAQAYVGKLMIQLRAKTEERIGELPISIEESTYYKRIMQFGDDELKERFKQYAEKEDTIGGVDQINAYGLKRVIISNEKASARFGLRLEKAIFLDGVKSIYQTFWGCRSLTSVMLPSSLTAIGNRTFCDCSSLAGITIPDAVTSIGDWAFRGCSSLTDIIIPDSVTSIGDGAFDGCSSLVNITIPDSVSHIGSGAFAGCSSLANITLPKSLTVIGNRMFSDCSSLTAITIPSSVTSIGDSAFCGCSSLKSITIPASVTGIGSGAFHNCNFGKNLHINFEGTTKQWNKIAKKDIYKNVTCGDTLEILRQEKIKQVQLWQSFGLCRYCGGEIRGVFKKVCTKCGRRKDYQAK